MNQKQIEMMSRIKEILNEAGYHLSEFSIHDIPIGNFREYITAITLEAKEFKKRDKK